MAFVSVPKTVHPSRSSSLHSTRSRAIRAYSRLKVSCSAQYSVISPHPDALRRRKEVEEMSRGRQLEREKHSNLEAAGLKWWQEECPQMATLSSPQQLLEHVDNVRDKLLVVKFFTEECYSCRSLHPKLKKIAESNPGVVFVKMNGTDPAFHSLFHDMGIKAVPWFHFYWNGKCVSSMSASLSPERLAAFRAEIALQSMAGKRDSNRA